MGKLYDIETALDAGNLWAAVSKGKYWKLRRNGRTKLWKTRPNEFRIPVKAGLRATGQISETDIVTQWGLKDWEHGAFVICADDPNKR